MKDDNILLDRARQLRKDMTEQERRLWYTFLRDHPAKIYKQRVVGPYILDFYCPAAKLAIELDGSQHYTDGGLEYDQRRNEYLRDRGITVLHISNDDVNRHFDSVCEGIDAAIKAAAPEVRK